MDTAYSNTNSIDIVLWIWFALTAVSVAFVAWDAQNANGKYAALRNC